MAIRWFVAAYSVSIVDEEVIERDVIKFRGTATTFLVEEIRTLLVVGLAFWLVSCLKLEYLLGWPIQ